MGNERGTKDVSLIALDGAGEFNFKSPVLMRCRLDDSLLLFLSSCTSFFAS